MPTVRDVTDETKASTESTLLGRLVALVVERIAQHNLDPDLLRDPELANTMTGEPPTCEIRIAFTQLHGR